MKLSATRNEAGFWQIINALKSLGDFAAWHLHKLWDIYKEWLSAKWAVFMQLLVVLHFVANWAIKLAKELFAMLGDYLIKQWDLALPASLLHTFEVANYILPVGETLVLFAGYGILMATMMVYHHLKSLVPGAVSGGT